MYSVSITQITESLSCLPAEKLVVVYDFIAFLAATEREKASSQQLTGDMPDMVLLPRTEYERLLARQRRRAAFQDLSQNLGRDVAAKGMSEEEFLADLEKTKHEVFTEQYGRSPAETARIH